jgi:hypothetical protein
MVTLALLPAVETRSTANGAFNPNQVSISQLKKMNPLNLPTDNDPIASWTKKPVFVLMLKRRMIGFEPT